jgi:hypothetical protein
MRPLAILALALAGCAATPNYYNTEQALPVLTIEVRSIPIGAVIYMNAEYVGTTPLQLKVVADKFGNWEQPTRIQAFVPHDTQSSEQALYPAGSRVPSRVLLRVPRYTHWYSATQPKAPQTLQVR